jgi:hypothetical protein
MSERSRQKRRSEKEASKIEWLKAVRTNSEGDLKCSKEAAFSRVLRGPPKRFSVAVQGTDASPYATSPGKSFGSG